MSTPREELDELLLDLDQYDAAAGLAHRLRGILTRLDNLEPPAQRQDSLFDQLRDLAVIAERQHGMYDAADWILRAIEIRKGFESLVPLVERYGTVTGRLPTDRLHIQDVDRD
jgi:hypothetical protein